MSTVVLLSLPGYKCSGLSEVASGELSPLVRKRAARHIDACDSCSAKRIEATSAAALFSSLPLIVAPDSLRERVGNTSQLSNQNSSNQDTDDDTPNGDRRDRSDRSAVKQDVEKGRSGPHKRRSEKPSKPKSTLRRLLVGATVVVGVAALLSLFVGQAPDSASLGGQRVSGDGVSTPLGPDRSFDVGTPTGTAADGSPLGPTGPSGSAQPTSTLPSDSPTSTPPSSSPTTLPSDSPTTLPASTLPQTSMPDTPPSTAAAPARATVTLLSATCSPLRANVRVMSQTQINSVTLIVTEVVPATGARLRYPMTLLTSDFTLDRWVATATGLESSVYRRSVEVTNAGGTTTLPISGTCDNSFE